MAAFSSKAGISAPGLPQLITFLRAAASRRAVRKLAPVGASSRSFSPFAKAPWQSEQPLDLHTSSPALVLSSLCEKAALAHTRAKAPAANQQATRAVPCFDFVGRLKIIFGLQLDCL